ncbi:hypothetical protein [Pseudomonas sp. CHM02]|uniref:hypothetical protein n=1 Tax=Pseudomonas sp. CHM02 TaxID=1463662 RepID=UPI0012DBF230|nr:hypothetical protein [Pseudomonas sp. CHM02]
MKWLLTALALFALAGCATTGKYERVLQSWVGSTELELVQSWGPPVRVYESNGHRFLTYSNEGSMYVPGTSPTYQTTYYGNTAYTNSYGGSPGMNVQLSCVTTFDVVDNRISSWRWQGNNCTSN